MYNNKFLGGYFPRIKINGTVMLDAVLDALNFKIRFERSQTVRATLRTVVSNLEFVSRGFSIFNDIRKGLKLCQTTDVVIEAHHPRTCLTESLFNGIIFQKDVQFDTGINKARSEIKDLTFYGILSDNKDVKVNLKAKVSKNNVDISSYFVTTDIDFFAPPANAITVNNRKCISVYQAFKIILAYISDDEITFKSDYLLSKADWKILSGDELRTGTGAVYPNISFATLFDALSKIGNLSFEASEKNGQKIIRIEPDSYFYQDTILNLDRVPNIKISTFQEQLYNTLNVGSDTHIENGALADVRWLTSKEEDYVIVANCGYDKALDLVIKDVVISSNVFQAVLGGDDSYDDSTFLVDTDGTQAVATNIYNTGVYIINRAFLNDQIVSNYYGYVPNNIAKELGTGDATFAAYKNTLSHYNTHANGSPDFIKPVEFSNETFDPSGSYNNATYRYTAAANGVYSFYSRVNITNILYSAMGGADPGNLDIQLKIQVLNAALVGTFTATEFYTVKNISPTVPQDLLMHVQTSVFLNATDIVQIEVRTLQAVDTTGSTSETIKFDMTIDDTHFKCTGSTTGGGVFFTSDPALIRRNLYEFDYPITFKDYLKIKSIPNGAIGISRTRDMTTGITGWIQSLEINPKGGISKWQIVSAEVLE